MMGIIVTSESASVAPGYDNAPYHCKVACVDADSICYAAGMADNVKEMEVVVREYIDKINDVLRPSFIVGFVEAITDKWIWRNFVAIHKPYKSNRSDRVDPPFKNEAKQYMHDAYGFQFAHTYESEDAISMYAHKYGVHNCVKCGCDGDLLTCPGYYMNYFGTKWKLPYYTEIDEWVIEVSEEQAKRNFYTQLVTGDGGDAIDGVRGAGPRAAERIVKDTPVDELPYAVARLYIDKGYSYHYFIEMARLLKILERRDEVCTPLTQAQWNELQESE